ncbi:unnamed protein product [Effrenium voratum]|nr:unnamed protein product [Effrenium voratum]
MAMDEALSWACVGLIYVGLAAAAVLLLQGKYLQMQRCLLLLTVGSNLRYPMLGLARGTTLLITVSNVFSYVSGVDPVDCNQITFDRLEGNEISMSLGSSQRHDGLDGSCQSAIPRSRGQRPERVFQFGEFPFGHGA